MQNKYEGVFLGKNSQATFSCNLFLQENSIIDSKQGPKYPFE